jgi:hypothetical protein
MAMTDLLTTIEHHPVVAFCICIINTVIAVSLPMMDIQVPVIVIQLFQILAASVTITVGLITINKHYRKR